MARQAHRLIAAKGKKVTTLELSQAQPSDAVLADLMLGPTGNMRAPTMRVGDTLLIGYNDDVFAHTFGSEHVKETVWPRMSLSIATLVEDPAIRRWSIYRVKVCRIQKKTWRETLRPCRN